MSAAALQPDASNVVLPYQSSASRRFHKFLSNLANLVPEVIADLARQSDDDVLNTRKQARVLDESYWRVECACDAEFVERAVKLKGGRGLRDVNAVGAKAAIARRAKQIGVTPRTVERNAQVFRLMEETSDREIACLTEKHFFVAALTAADPAKAVDRFIERKGEGLRFKVSDAYRLLASEGLTKKQHNQKALTKIRESKQLSGRAEQIAHLQRTIATVNSEILPDCHDEDILRIHESYLEELQDHLNLMVDDDVATALRASWDKGKHWEHEIVQDTGFAADTVSRIMKLLGADGEFIPVPGGSANQTRWHKAGVLPLPAELTRLRKV